MCIRDRDYAVHYYSDIYSALQKHYLEYRQPYLKMAAISCPRFITYTNENIACRPDADLTKELIALAEAGEGSPVWVTSHAEDHGIFLVREIKKIKNLRLDNLGTLIINVNPVSYTHLFMQCTATAPTGSSI